MNVSNVLESFLHTLNGMGEFLEKVSGIKWSNIRNGTWSKFENVINEFQEFQQILYEFFKNEGIGAFKIIFSNLEQSWEFLILLLINFLVLLYACHIAVSGIRSRKSVTLFPIVAFIVYLVIAPQKLSFISSFENFIENLLKEKYPKLAEVVLDFDVPVLLFSMLIAYLLSCFYSFCKYIVFVYITMSIWNLTIPSSAASSHYLFFFLISTLLLLAYLKMFHIVEMIFLSILFALTSSFIFIQYLGLVVGKNEVLDLVNNIFSFTIDFGDKLTLIFVTLSVLSLLWQYLVLNEKTPSHYGFRPECSI
ncbi:uncharacterized protein VICG_00676 [Vittaforma corneae ATCC 50505]|uniref:Uncharacterized protein n=1 Tax=Vittaforma corneae (strain ATCC 50505) TaxID=993615 RepID=L2GN70_VITCO|nr:uncharacterized protein VICG_00676 [Vittaforma corneae ATCC 50505]ELA42276.1 hypothetical protein VICG_00676 [Vittaforma corneae ATCC 50505]